MDKRDLIKKTIAGILYIGGILFAIYVGIIIFKGNSIFDVEGLITSGMCVCIPIALASYILISTMPEVEKRFKTIKVFIIIVFGFYIMLLITILFRNGFRHIEAINTINISEYIKMNTNFIPFKTIGNYIKFFINDTINKSIIIENLFGNLLLFAPMGILLPSIFQNLSKFKKFLTTMLVVLFSVEIVQLLTSTGSFDIDDIILNLIGAVLFYGFWRLNGIQKILRKMYIIKS